VLSLDVAMKRFLRHADMLDFPPFISSADYHKPADHHWPENASHGTGSAALHR
jgi:hypothetical protein